MASRAEVTGPVRRFEPIAIVGRSCILPGALSPAALWDEVVGGRCAIGAAPQGRWGLPADLVMGTGPDRTWSDAGGYVSGFEGIFDPEGFRIPKDEILALDPLFQWVLHGAREALREASGAAADRGGLVLGNLSFPSSSMTHFAEHTWLVRSGLLGGKAAEVAGLARPDARNRFMSGLPALLAARALGLGAGGFALDAACASSLYAIELACQTLQDRRADFMIAGAVNRADDLFIHLGFCALSAISRTGRSRPFSRHADGLVPAEGAAFVALERLDDAVKKGRRIHGVIRGIGLSNDGRGRGLLAPAEDGQLRAMRLAHARAGLLPSDISLVECHATGTPVGDAAEVRSMSGLFAGLEGVPIGSLKSNLGHLITVAGAAGLIKVLEALKAGVRPPTLAADDPIEVLRDSPFRLLDRAEPWNTSGPRRAAVSGFGFGGNNAHLLVEEYDPQAPVIVVPPLPSLPVAVVGIGARVADGAGQGDFLRTIVEGRQVKRRAVEVSLERLRFPPRDLEHTLAQQLLMLEAAREAASGRTLPSERTAVLVGMGCDPEVVRYGARWHVPHWAEAWRAAGLPISEEWVAAARDAMQEPLEAAGVVGTMPNMPANRINSQLDLGAAGFTVAAEELSGLIALELAVRMLRAGDVDAAIVGAVDLSHEEVHAEALRSLGIERAPADAAVALVVKRLEDAERDGDEVLAVLEEGEGFGLRVSAADRIGWAHAASGLLEVAAAVVLGRAGVRPDGTPWIGARRAIVEVRSFTGDVARVAVRSDARPTGFAAEAPRLHVFAGADRNDVRRRLIDDVPHGEGPTRLVLVATAAERSARREAALRWLEVGVGPLPEGVAFRDWPIGGQMAFVFTGAAAAYSGMGRELVAAMPELADGIETTVADGMSWVYSGGVPQHPLDQLWGASALCQMHAALSRRVLGLQPQATIGYSSGESNALFAMGAWTDLASFIVDTRGSALFTRGLVPPYEAIGTDWKSVAIAAPVDAVAKAVAAERGARLTIINTADEAVVAGEPAAVDRVVARIGVGRAMPLDYAMAAHCPELAAVRDAWYALHRRPTVDVPGVRFYTAANGGESYRADADAAARAITAQALTTLDFPKVIERAWSEGVRVFVEHGPRALCSRWIARILGDREHVVVSLDNAGRSSVRQALNAVAGLVAAGVRVDAQRLVDRIERARPAACLQGSVLGFVAHPPLARLPELALAAAEAVAPQDEAPQGMAPAPWLPSVLEDEVPMLVERVGEAGVVALAPPPATIATAPPAIAALLEEILATRSQLVGLHQAFLTQQREARQRRRASAPPPKPETLQARAVVVESPAVIERPAAPGSTPGAGAVRQGPPFDRRQLEILASGRISEVFGPEFRGQDGFVRQVRMPEPPLLLADRVTRIDAVPRSMKTGVLSTETDVRPDSWYLHDGRMPAGIHIESGQADLLLISWLGVDFLNRSERVYRLLSCELTWHEAEGKGVLPQVGETLAYDIHIDGHAALGEIRLMFFHYECRIDGQPRLSVRAGEAGFFTDAELAESGGVIWSAESAAAVPGPLDAPAVACTKTSFDRGDLEAFAAGRPWDCFGPGWELTQPHVRSPRIQSGRMLFLDHVTHFDPAGGPWKRGYLRAEQPITADDWFFKGHFKNDPCMPGTLMFEGCVQTMAFYLAALGYTIDKDGWRFEPVPEQKYQLRCRGQVIPTSKRLVYEVFVHEVTAGPTPTVFADLLCTVDGLKAFHARRVGLRLVPDWPLASWQHAPAVPAARTALEAADWPRYGGLAGYVEAKPVATAPDGFPFDYASLLACGWGRPTAAFGPMYAPFDSTRKVARLPGPPYHFMSRVTRTEGVLGELKAGAATEVEYDIPAEAWYFAENGHPTLPLSVLMEAALQPCGWLASYVGSTLAAPTDVMFRNLDGTGTLHAEILPGSGTLRTCVKMLSVSRSAGMIIQTFAVECFLGEKKVYELSTVFGFFPKEAFENQAGLPVSAEEKERITSPSNVFTDLRARPAKCCSGTARLAGPMLLMLDRVTAFHPHGGKAGKGWVRAEKDVDPGEWFFKAHFFQDPVQPGSLGIEALSQLLQWWMLETGMAEDLPGARFEPIALGRPCTWKYRGQVVPKNRLITTELEIVEVGEDERGRFAVADAALWVDGKRIYSAKNLAMRLVPGPSRAPSPASGPVEETLDPAVDTWVGDHRPTWTVPALPMMSMVDRLLSAARAAGRPARGLDNVRLHRWLLVPGAVRVRTTLNGDAASLSAWREARDPRLSRFEDVASGRIVDAAGDVPGPLVPLGEAETVAVPDPYRSGTLFHGPAFQHLKQLRMGVAGASAVLDAGAGSVPYGACHPGLLDAMTHAIPHDELARWSHEIPAGVVGYPYRIPSIRFYAPIPTAGRLRVEARFAGFEGDDRRLPIVELQLIEGDGSSAAVLMAVRLVDILVPITRIGLAPPADRRAFLAERRYVDGLGLSANGVEGTSISKAEVAAADWLPGNVARFYGLAPDVEAAPHVAIKDHVARRVKVHPSRVEVAPDLASAVASTRPLRRHRVTVEPCANRLLVRDAGPAVQDLGPVRAYWDKWSPIGRWPIEDVYYGLVSRFVGDVVLADPDAFAAVRGRSCLYLANHQVAVESLLCSTIVSGLSHVSTVTLAKAEHRTSWIGKLIELSFSYPGVTDPKVIAFFQREDRDSLPRIIGELAREMATTGKSVIVHVEGTRSLSCRTPVLKMSSAFIDMALAVNAPIVPVRFTGGLPGTDVPKRLEFPVGFGRQDYWFGRPILPEELRPRPLKERKDLVIDALNALGPAHDVEMPSAPESEFEASIVEWVERTGATAEHATLFRTLEASPDKHPAIARLIDGARQGRLELGSDAKDRWLAELARRLFGDRGPQVV
jgi:acyl transferase domain-containing protein/3-hydroxymyristoyl/3-hydroxydecanoyl-(acyl carrier protein) dehydratase/1-acyl-sn-glycerol-3-phosphate acyltransferase